MNRFVIKDDQLIVLSEPRPELEKFLINLYCNWQQFYAITQSAHRNITSEPGQEFFTAHLLLERIYNEAGEEIDGLGEHIRGCYGIKLPDDAEAFAQGATIPKPSKGISYMRLVMVDAVALHDNLIEVARLSREPELLGTNTLIGDLMVLVESWLYLLHSQLSTSFASKAS
jgi:DNA-binding ferritin-like protein